MKTQKAVLGKVFKGVLLGAICVTPLIGSMTPAQADKPGWSHGHNDHNRDKNHFETFTGTVTKVDSDRHFDIRVNGHTYNVELAGRAPRHFDRGEGGRVYGHRSGINNIINGRVDIVKNR